MEPVAVALLATLLPTLLIIFFLACVAIYLYAKLRANRISYQTIELQLRTAAARLLELEPTLPITPPEDVLDLEPERCPISEDTLNPDWMMDCFSIFLEMQFVIPPGEPYIDPFPSLEPRLEGLLKTIGYNYAPVEVIKKLLRNRATRNKILTHIITFAIVAKTDLEGELSFLWSISPELRRDILEGFEALKGIPLPSEFSKLLLKILAQVIEGHEEFNKESLKRTINDLHELALSIFIHYHNKEDPDVDYVFDFDDGKWIYRFKEKLLCSIRYLAIIQLRMLISPRQLRWDWGEVSERTISVEPHLCAYTTKDGVALEEPEFLAEGEVFHFAEDGTCTRQTQRWDLLLLDKREREKREAIEREEREGTEREGTS